MVASALLALAAAMLLSDRSSRGQRAVQTGPIWRPGTEWTVRVVQDASVAAPERSMDQSYEQVYDFRVASAPTAAAGEWRIDARLEGARGPAADGFRLYYVRDGGGFTLRRVAIGGQKPLDRSYGPVLFGQAFPFQDHVTDTPRDRRVIAENGGAGSAGSATP